MPPRKPIVPLTEDEQDVVSANLRLCRQVVWTMKKKNPHYDQDFFQQAVLGLIDAIRNYDPTLNRNFRDYARHRMKGACLDFLRYEGVIRHGRKSKVPKSERPRVVRIDVEAGGLLIKRHGKMDGEKIDVGDVMLPPSKEPDPFETVAHDDAFEAIMVGLNADEKTILREYYGPVEVTIVRIAELLGLKPSRTSQLHREILGRLQARRNERRYRELLSA